MRTRSIPLMINRSDFYLFQSNIYWREIVKLTNYLRKHHIGFVFLKGLPVYFFYSKGFPKYRFADCDILIDPIDKHRTASVLNKLNFQPKETSLSTIQKYFRTDEVETMYVKYVSGFPVVFDVHYTIPLSNIQTGRIDSLYPKKSIKELGVFFLKQSRMRRVKGVPVPLMKHVPQTVYLLINFYHHNFLGIYRARFLKKIASTCSLREWRQICLITDRYNLQGFVYSSLFVLKRQKRVSLPKFVVSKCSQYASLHRIFFYFVLLSSRSLIEEDRIKTAVRRFLYFFYLSPGPFYKKIVSLFHPTVLASFFTFLYLVFFPHKRKNHLDG